MHKSMKVTAWPNGLGWDVSNVGVDAEVWKLETGLKVRILTRDNKIRSLFINDPALDPVTAVERCTRGLPRPEPRLHAVCTQRQASQSRTAWTVQPWREAHFVRV